MRCCVDFHRRGRRDSRGAGGVGCKHAANTGLPQQNGPGNGLSVRPGYARTEPVESRFHADPVVRVVDVDVLDHHVPARVDVHLWGGTGCGSREGDVGEGKSSLPDLCRHRELKTAEVKVCPWCVWRVWWCVARRVAAACVCAAWVQIRRRQ